MPLWPHQERALSTLRSYLRLEAVSGAALVAMPTGTGKSAIIAQLVASPEVVDSGKSVLVLTPWSGLARQLKHDIDVRVWQRLDVERPTTLPKVRSVRSAASLVTALSEDGSDPAVYVTTFAMILQIFKTVDSEQTAMTALFERVAAVIVDECHYEPAPAWSEAVRATQVPICLFTATPFRNDNRMFDLQPNSHYRYSHDRAVSDSILREPRFERIAHRESSFDFVDDLLAVADSQLQATDRIIVRCGTKVEVEAIATALHTSGRTVLGVHEGFVQRPDVPYLRKHVPSPENMPDVRFYVHQNKLVEGFDDPAVRMLVIRDEFGNDRARVQQIGRILRNPSREPNAEAILLAATDKMKDAWSRYRRFDSGLDPSAIATDPVGVARLLGAQPELFYWDRLFREKAEMSAPLAWQKLKFQLSAVVRTTPDDFELASLVKDIERDLASANVMVLNQEQPDDDVYVLVHVTMRNSPVLQEAAFVEVFLGYTVVHWDGSYLFVSSSGPVPDCVRTKTSPVHAEALGGLLPASATITSMSLANNDLSEWAVRSRSLSARDLGLIASEVGDSTFGYSTASGTLRVAGDVVYRYTGAKNGRVSDTRATDGRYEQLVSWYSEISAALRAGQPPAASITRYGAPQPTPVNPVPAHVLLDIDPESFEPIDGSSDPLVLDRSGGAVDAGNFTVEINGAEVNGVIRWDASRKRFDVGSNESIRYRSRTDSTVDFWQSINKNQSLRVATREGLIYSNQSFWKIARRDSDHDLGLISILEVLTDLETVDGEKGHADATSLWPARTVFGVIERMTAPGAPHEMEALLCTDLGSEIADFIALDPQKVVFMHAKSKKESVSSEISASALHEVVAQATKSLRYLTIGNGDTPRTSYWGEDWYWRDLGPTPRLRRGDLGASGADRWKAIDTVIQSHAAVREVWLVLGACLSKSALKEELGKENPKPEALQSHALLTAMWSAAQQCGIRVRIFCST